MKSFQYAAAGILSALRSEPNLRFHVAAALIAGLTGYFLHISNIEWVAIVLCVVLVLGFELLNTAIEALCNHVTEEIHPAIKKVKDISAAAVLIVCTGSVVAGLIIFLPKIIAII